MIIIKKFDKWIPDREKLDSGKGKKIWLTNPRNANVNGWFKYVKCTKEKYENDKSINTFENISEKIADLIAKRLKIKNAKIDIGTYNNEIGCLSYNVLRDNQTMSEGVAYISRIYNKYDSNLCQDIESGEYYCLQMILNSLPNEELKNEFLKIMIFDFLIGNSDRHSNNWAVIKNRSNKESIAPLYDNGSSLCSLVKESEIKSYLGVDKLKFEALVDTKSRTIVRINGKNKSKPTHKEVLRYLSENYYNKTEDFAKSVVQKLSDEEIMDILRDVKEYISEDRLLLIRKYLKAKVKILKDIYKIGGGQNKKY